MGQCNSASSTSEGNNPPASMNQRSSVKNLADGTNRRVQIFEPAINQGSIDLTKLFKEKNLDVETRILLVDALSRLFGDENAKKNMRLVVGAMVRRSVLQLFRSYIPKLFFSHFSGEGIYCGGPRDNCRGRAGR